LSGLGQFRGRIAALGGVIVLLLAGGITLVVTHSPAHAKSVSSSASSGGSGRVNDVSQAKPKPALRVVSFTPARGSKGVNGTAPVRVQFSTALAPDSPMPTITPQVAGNWVADGKDAVKFVPTMGFGQSLHVKVHVPNGAAGVRSVDGQLLAHARTARFETAGYSTVRLAELLGQLGYLPLTWAPSAGQTSPAIGGHNLAAQISAAYAPPQGSFTWKRGYPTELTTFWDSGSPTGLIVHGAVMAFESDHGIVLDGEAGPEVWHALLIAAARDQANTHGYTYARASQHSPETLTIWHDGRIVLHTAANTGIPAAPTTVGTAAVYLRYRNQVMRGTNPDGSKYADPVQFVAYFRAGEAVHYFPRYSYGFQQSLGCVELPLGEAGQAWPYLTYGSLVTVTPA
jgi:peptidoglycan hydrolase-like protein with peptidoglycan-binding domain